MRPADRASDAASAMESHAAEAEPESPKQIREQIEQTRGDMSETIDAIQDRLNPDRLKEQVKESVREATIGRAEQMVSDVTDTARHTGNSVLDRVKANPVPAALIGIGLGWMMLRGKSDQGAGGRTYRYERYDRSAPDYVPEHESYRDYGDYERRGYPSTRRAGRYQSGGGQSGVGAAAGQVGDTARQAVSGAGDKVQQAAGQATDTMQHVAGQAGDAVQNVAGHAQQLGGQAVDQVQQFGTDMQYRVARARYSLEGLLEDSPLAVGAIALAAGAAVGLAFPTTEPESRMMGQARDSFMQKAQETAQQTLDKVQYVAGAAKDTAQEEAQKQGLTGSTSSAT